jgi:hypothetical protein
MIASFESVWQGAVRKSGAIMGMPQYAVKLIRWPRNAAIDDANRAAARKRRAATQPGIIRDFVRGASNFESARWGRKQAIVTLCRRRTTPVFGD